ncbi:MAG: hypothetical protein ACR2QK_14730 [Acidimicrobiales bacterium]
MQPVRHDPIHLALDESPVDHPSAGIRHYLPDLALLNYLLQDLRALLRRAAADQLTLSPHQEITWFVHGLKRRTVICDPAALLVPGDVLIVGFCGDRRSTGEAAGVDHAELDVIAEFPDYPGILSYSSVELVDNQWANLVVHTSPTDRREWRHGKVHIRAAEELAPLVYHNVRIHNGGIRNGPIGSDTVAIVTTKYFDYDCDPMWHAERVLPGGASETVGSPWPEWP